MHTTYLKYSLWETLGYQAFCRKKLVSKCLKLGH